MQCILYTFVFHKGGGLHIHRCVRVTVDTRETCFWDQAFDALSTSTPELPCCLWYWLHLARP